MKEIKDMEKLGGDFKNLEPASRLFSIGALYHVCENLDKAKEYYLLSLREKDSYAVKYKLARAYVEGREYDEAKSILKDIIETQPSFIDASVLYGDVLMDTGEHQEASDVYRELLEREEIKDYTKISYLYHNLGLNLYREGKIEESIKCFCKALDSMNRVTDALFPGVVTNLAKTYYKAGMMEKAEEMLRWGIEKDSAIADFHVVLGAIYSAENRLDQAKEALERALEIDPYNTSAQAGLEEIKAKGDGVDL
ncbi:MAG: tetratricopeptide repeat protein [Theionarchaea archaeon]|nr:tetratricopeptide repeat protein [Theionarchaea archaeon]